MTPAPSVPNNFATNDSRFTRILWLPINSNNMLFLQSEAVLDKTGLKIKTC